MCECYLQSPETEPESRRGGVVSKLLGVMGRQDRGNKKYDKHKKKVYIY